MLIAQLSDLHICEYNQLYKGVVSSNEMAINAINHINSLNPQPDLVVVTGDIVENGSPAEYANARKMFRALRAPMLAIPGNHDEREAFRAAFPQPGCPIEGPINYVNDDYPIRIVALDVTVPEEHYGEPTGTTLAWLARVLAQRPNVPTIILMHQPPFRSWVPYLDQYMCRSGEQLGKILDGFPCVERVLCGHVHRSMQTLWHGTLVMSSPSTATQIALRMEENSQPASYLEPPGCLLHHWTPQFGMVSHLSYIGSYPGPFPFA
jgi:3',5'-cyclic AMP phosphodiesterase CpdA